VFWGKPGANRQPLGNSSALLLVIDAEKFDSSVREGLVEFFLTALHRDPAKRFANAEEMRWAWQQVFKEAEGRKVVTPTGEEVDLSVTLDQVDLKTPIPVQ
jgi:hypothetical protein